MTQPTDPEKRREKAETKRELAAAVEQLRQTLKSAEKVADTPLSKLFHEARTRSRDPHRSVSLFLDYDHEAETWEASKVTPLQQGEHWNSDARNAHDLTLSIGIKSFMDSDTFRDVIGGDLSRGVQSLKQDAQRYEEGAKHIEQMRNREESR